MDGKDVSTNLRGLDQRAKRKKKKLSYIVEYMVDSQSAPIHLSILSITMNYTQQLLQKPTNFTFYSP